jgi:hypothetical protein
MRYLKLFKESVSTSELKSYCDNYLAYLYDDGYVVTLVRYDKKYYGSDDFYFRMSVRRDRDFYKTKKSEEFYWNDVKDQFIPFLYQLNKDYKLDDLKDSGFSHRNWNHLFGKSDQIRFWNYDHQSYTDYKYEEILNDEVRNKKIVEIVFHVKDEI